MLSDLLERWIVPAGQSVAAVRDDNGLKGVDFWKMQRMAAGYLDEIERLLTAIDAIGGDTEDFRATMDDWAKAVFVPEQAWHGGASVETRIDPRDLKLLRALASQIDMMDLSPNFSETQLLDLKALFAEAREMVLGATSLPTAVRAYIVGLISEADAAISDLQLFGESRLRSCTIELGGSLVTVVGTPQVEASSALRSRLGGMAFRLLATIGINLISHGAITGFDALIADLELDEDEQVRELPRSD